MYRTYVYAVSAALVALTLWPAFRDPPADSFPFSDYPMFSHGRPDALMTLSQAVGVGPDGRRTPLPPIVSADNREVLQSMMIIENAVRGGPERARTFCDEVARRVAASDDPALRRVTRVEIATSRWDAVRYFAESPEPIERHVHATCEVPER